jgi:hypothetical protein
MQRAPRTRAIKFMFEGTYEKRQSERVQLLECTRIARVVLETFSTLYVIFRPKLSSLNSLKHKNILYSSIHFYNTITVIRVFICGRKVHYGKSGGHKRSKFRLNMYMQCSTVKRRDLLQYWNMVFVFHILRDERDADLVH